MNPQEMLAWLQKASRLRAKGVKPETVDAWLASRTSGAFASTSDLRTALSAARQAQNRQDQRDATGKLGYLGGLANNFAQGVTANNFDELMGAAAAVIPGGQNYQQARDQYRQVAEDFAGQHPVAGNLAQIGGGVASGLLMGNAMGAATTAPSYLKSIGQGLLGGAGFGAASGVGSANSMADVPHDAAMGAATGAATGAVLGATVPPALWLLRRGKDWAGMLRGNPLVLRKIADMQVGSALGSGADDAAAALKPLDRAVELGLPLPVPADANSAATRVTRKAINTSPPLTDVASELQVARMGQRPNALAKGLAKETGIPEAVARETVRGSKKATEQAGRILYQGLNPTVLDETTGIPQLLDQLAASHPEVATQIARMAKRQPGEPLTFQVVNSIRQHLSEVGWKFRGIGKEHAIGDALVQASDAIETALSNPNGPTPAYAGVRAKYKALMDVQRAYAIGARSAQTAMTDADMEAYNAMSDQAKEAWRIGKQAATTGKIRSSNVLQPGAPFRPLSNATASGDIPGEILAPGREGWKAMFPNPENAANYDELVRLGRRQVGTESRLTGGSLTDQGVSDLGVNMTQQIAKTSASGPQSFRAGLMRNVMDALMSPGQQKVGAMVGTDMMAPYTAETRKQLLRQINMAKSLQRRQGLLNLMAILGATTGLEQSPLAP